MEKPDPTRTYFTLTDESGKGHPAVEYLAGTLDAGPVVHIMPLKRFVKLIGSGEPLEALDDGRYMGRLSRRTYSVRAVATLAADPAREPAAHAAVVSLSPGLDDS